MRLAFIVLICIMVTACSNNIPAPVVNAWLEPQAQSADYIVRKGDTIYSIAWQFGLNYLVLAQVNHLKFPYRIYPGKRLKMTNVARGVTLPVNPPVNLPIQATAPRKKIANSTWRWPAAGKVVQGYSRVLGGNAGINIAGALGSPVRAALAGEVVYSGNGVRGYGNLIIIKHDSHYLSAYAYNQKLRVHLGQRVVTGAPIATMGKDPAGQVMLHFEIRYNGQSVDPLRFLR